MANAANLINFGTAGGSLAVGDWTYSAYPLTAPSYLPMTDQYASYLVSSYPTLGALYTTPAASYAATSVTPAGTSTVNQVVYGNGVWVIVGLGSFVLTSVDGTTWVKRPTPITIGSLAYGNGLFLGISSSGLTCAYSFNGISWIQGTNTPSASSYYVMGFANGNFFNYSNGAGSSTVYVTTNGLNWSTVSTVGIAETNLAYGNGTIVIASSPTYNSIVRSTDGGYTWSSVTVSGGSGLAFGNNIFVLLPNSGSTAYSTSADGATWTSRTFPASLNWIVGSCITFGNGVFLAVSATSGTTAYSSVDGINWTARVLPSTRSWSYIGYGGPSNSGYFICTGSGSGANIGKLTLSVAQTTFNVPLISNNIANTVPYIKAS